MLLSIAVVLFGVNLHAETDLKFYYCNQVSNGQSGIHLVVNGPSIRIHINGLNGMVFRNPLICASRKSGQVGEFEQYTISKIFTCDPDLKSLLLSGDKAKLIYRTGDELEFICQPE
jgi:hypothetical protein